VVLVLFGFVAPRALHASSHVLELSSGAEKILAHTNRIFAAFARPNLGDWQGLRVGAIHLLAFLTFDKRYPKSLVRHFQDFFTRELQHNPQ
jgi:hypothetical protein